jgi:deoxyribose-phosphate aldolase
MRGVAGDKIGVKASGGIRTLHDAQAMVDAGANRIGTSAARAILEEARGQRS